MSLSLNKITDLGKSQLQSSYIDFSHYKVCISYYIREEKMIFIDFSKIDFDKLNKSV